MQIICDVSFAVSQIILIFAANHLGARTFNLTFMMEEKKYPIIEEEDDSCMTASEPAVAYATREKNSSDIEYMDEETKNIDRTPLGMFGFYTDDPEVFQQRVAEMEADMDEIDAGIEDPKKWIQVDDFWAAMRKEHPWL